MLERTRDWWRNTRTPAHIAFRRPWPSTRRGLALFLFAIATAWLGVVNYVLTDLPPYSQRSLSFALTIADGHTWGWIMVAVATVTAWSAFCHLGRDRIGFVLLGGFCGVWGVGYLCGFLFYEAGPRALGGSVIWLLFSGILAVVAGFPNVPLHRSDIVSKACRPGDLG